MILVIGDMIIDEHIECEVDHLSPEGPVPECRVVSTHSQLGGAGNIAKQIVEFEECGLVYIAEELRETMTVKMPFEDYPIHCKDYTWPKKQRIWGRCGVVSQQVCRVAYETKLEYEGQSLVKDGKEVTGLVQELEPRVVVLVDYGKGLLNKDLVCKIIRVCNEIGAKVIMDPKAPYFRDVKGLYAVTPNRREVERTGLSAMALSRYIGNTYLIETLAEQGLKVWQQGRLVCVCLSMCEGQVVDTIGAGECLTAFVAIMTARGSNIQGAVERGSLEAGKTVLHRGCYIVRKTETSPGHSIPEWAVGPHMPPPRVRE